MFDHQAFHPRNHWLDMARPHLLSKFKIGKENANICQRCSRACPSNPARPPAVHHMPTLAKCSPYALRRPLSNCDCNGCSHQTIRFPATFTGRRPKATIQRLLRAVRGGVAGARLQHFCALPRHRLSPRRRRPASVSNCCGCPQIPTAD